MTATRTLDDHVMAEINITPFTDVLLVLLIIFMILAAIAVPPGFQKEYAPPPLAGAGSRPPKQIEVAVTARGSVVIDGARVSAALLYPAVAAAVKAHTNRPGYTSHIALTAADAAPYAVVIRILDAARLAGDDDVGFVTYRQAGRH